jgi:hypothetical protein
VLPRCLPALQGGVDLAPRGWELVPRRSGRNFAVLLRIPDPSPRRGGEALSRQRPSQGSVFGWIYCDDGCGRRVGGCEGLDVLERGAARIGWAVGPPKDRCPACRAGPKARAPASP